MYPETGPLRRELYARHMVFFAGGAEHMERCMMAANRVGKCVTADTIIETSIGERTIGELWHRAQSVNVMAWDGTGTTQTEALPPFKKARTHDCYRVTMSDGRWFTGADLHRVLTSRGWRYLDELHQEFSSGLPASSVGRGPLAHGASEQNWRRTVQGWLGGPWSLPNVDGSIITSIDSVGRNEVYDFHVPRYENYVTRGVVHHNTWGVGAYETTCHLTGLYPEWWVGRRFDRPIEAWTAGDTSETTRDVIQVALTGVGGEGGDGEMGTGMIPAHLIVGNPSTKRGISGAFDTLRVRHVSGGISKIGFKAYDQGRAKFQGTKKDLVWLDEEPDIHVYEECVLRLTATTPGDENGLMLCTFTPLNGISKVALKFLPELAPSETVNGI